MAVLSTLNFKYSNLFFAAQLLIISILIKTFHGVFSRQKSRGETEIRLNAAFWRRFIPLLKICVPGIFTKEAFGVGTFTTLLFLRTKLTLELAAIIGRNGKYLVQKNFKSFAYGVLDLGLLAIPGSILEVGIQYTKLMVQQQFMDNIQNALQKQYLKDNNIYTLVTKHYLDNPDHRIAQDAKLFCKELTDFFRSVLKPLFDVVIFAVALSSNGGYGAPLFLISYYVLVGTLMSTFLPNFAYLVARSEEKEGNLRANHNQLIQHAEEVAFYGGEDIERQHADRLMKIITKHERIIKNVKWWGSLLDKVLIKYGATCIGYLVCGASVAEKRGILDAAQLTELYLTNIQLYIPFSVSIGKLLLLRKKIGALCGSTHRVGELREVLHRLSFNEKKSSLENYVEIDGSEQILFSNADIVAPDGNVIISKLTLRIQKHNNILIMGSNGSGKSAIVRALSQLWPIPNGTITTPSYTKMIFLPQRAYLPPGTLRAQMVYPLIETEAQEKVSDEDLLNYVDLIGIPHVVEREGGLDSVRNWHEVLSGGERQRIALIRVLVNNPIFAVLDECTSAISQDDEVKLYAILQKAGITLITISHREALKTIHDTLLELDGAGRYKVTSLRILSSFS